MWTWDIYINNQIRHDIGIYPVSSLPIFTFFNKKYSIYLHKPEICGGYTANKTYYDIPLIDFQHCNFQTQVDKLHHVAIIVYNITNQTETVYLDSPLYIVDNKFEKFFHYTNNIYLYNFGCFFIFIAPFIFIFSSLIYRLFTRAYYRHKFMKSFNFTKIEDNPTFDSTCTICQETTTKDIVETKCKHYFHNDCIKKWCLESKLCPNCKQNMIHDKLTPLISV